MEIVRYHKHLTTHMSLIILSVPKIIIEGNNSYFLSHIVHSQILRPESRQIHEILKSLLFVNHFETYLTVDDPLSNAADWYTREKNQNGVRPMSIYLQKGNPLVLHNNGNGFTTEKVISMSKDIRFDGSGPTEDIHPTVAKGKSFLSNCC